MVGWDTGWEQDASLSATMDPKKNQQGATNPFEHVQAERGPYKSFQIIGFINAVRRKGINPKHTAKHARLHPGAAPDFRVG
jgi:hypothetical protein